ncbi:MAG: DUF4838 domain-containing protein [Lentisphaeria bacterium]|nr:DUF4838 domain-containing protein [Lentisphaeria bacterium]
MKKYGLLVIGMLAMFLCSGWTVNVREAATPPERQGKQELERYLPQAATALKIGEKDVVTIEVLRDDEHFADEEYEIRIEDDTITLVGGGSRGALYAVYAFLENHIGIHWWPLYGDYVPPQREFTLQPGTSRHKPAFLRREVWTNRYPDCFHQGGRWHVANRLNNTGNIKLMPEYGTGRYGAVEYGSPYLVHTFDFYVPAAEMLESHPEYFGLWDGKRIGGLVTGQLCLSNRELRAYVKEKLKQYILSDEEVARNTGNPAPLIYSFSQNDNERPCQCENCRAIVAREGAESGLVLDFINEMADFLHEFRPQLYIDTLAYLFSTEPPKHIRPRENVIIRYCDVNSDYRFGPLHPQNSRMRKELEAWSQFGNMLSIWDYHVLYGGDCFEYAAPSEYTYPELFQFYNRIGAKVFFIQSEDPQKSDMYELKVWLAAKYLEDPEQDFETLRKEFMTCYYGAAAPALSRYRDILHEEAEKHPTKTLMTFYNPPNDVWNYLSFEGAVACIQACQEAEAAVADDPVLSLRTRRATAGLYALVSTLLGRQYRTEWISSGHDISDYPIKQKELLDKYLSARYEWGKLITPNYDQTEEIEKMRTRGMVQLCDVAPLPETFTKGDFVDFPTDKITIPPACDEYVSIIHDPESDTGSAIRVDCDSPKATYHFPVPQVAGIYDTDAARVLNSIDIPLETTQKQGYNWLHLGRVRLGSGNNVFYVGGAWAVQSFTGVREEWKNREVDVYVSVRFEGPEYRPMAAGENYIYVNRFVIVAAE